MMWPKRVTRFELIDHRDDAPEIGRLISTYGNITVAFEEQDGGRTLKIFLAGSWKARLPEHIAALEEDFRKLREPSHGG